MTAKMPLRTIDAGDLQVLHKLAIGIPHVNV